MMDLLKSLFKPGIPSGIFVPNGKGFKELKDVVLHKSVNGVSEYLGYHTDQIFSYLGDFDNDFDISVVIFEIFSKNIIAILTKDHVSKIEIGKLNYFIRNLNDKVLFDSYNVESILSKGIKNQTLTIYFLSRVLNLKDVDPNGIFYAEKLGMYLYFNDSTLSSFQPSDGLNKWAKHWKQLNSYLIEAYEEEAKYYWKNNSKQILNEINIQSDALAGTPQVTGNEFAHLHRTDFGTINFAMLLVCHYDKKISLSEFLIINHGRYSEVMQPHKSVLEYKLGNFKYTFLQDGTLQQINSLSLY